jgi:hypothetical protein
MVAPHDLIWLASGHILLNSCVFHILNNFNPEEQDMVEERVEQCLVKPTWGANRNTLFLAPKKDEKYQFIISAISMNRDTHRNGISAAKH